MSALAEALDEMMCDTCGKIAADQASVSDKGNEWGFCSVAVHGPLRPAHLDRRAMIGRTVICSRCRREATCRAVLDVQHAPRRVFCDAGCMTRFVSENYTEITGATATPAEAPRPPWGPSRPGSEPARVVPSGKWGLPGLLRLLAGGRP